MSMATHLRSASRPTFRRTRVGRIYVWTECGLEVDAVLVDNECASCARCNEVAERAIIIRALTAYCEAHVESVRDWTNNVGLTCDELGCGICNGPDNAELAARWIDESDDFPLPFDPDDAEQLADWIAEADERGIE